MAKSSLRVLADILSDAVDRIDSQYSAANLRFPTLDDPFNPESPVDVLLGHQPVVEQGKIIVAVAEQLCAMVRNPASSLMEIGMAHHRSSCLRVSLDGNVPEILREAGPKGLHAKDIAQKNGLDPKKLSRVLRLLSTYHVFKEITPDVYANNRMSLVLDTKKPVSTLSCPPKGTKYVGSNGVAAVLLHLSDEVMKGSAFLSEHLICPKTGHSEEPYETPLNRVFGTNEPQFIWLSKPENVDRSVRFHAGMASVRFAEQIVAPDAFPWHTLAPGSTIVDVGGGVGTVSMEISKHCPDLNFVIQDFSDVVDQGKEFWNESLPGRFESGKVVFQAHDFFKPQPVKNADVFVLRAVVHDWPDAYIIQILKRLREAAVPGKTKLVLLESVLNHACKDLPAGVEDIVGIDKLAPSVPEPLLPNLGRGSGWVTHLDLTMMIVLHGQERMISGHMHVCKEAGWKITHLYSPTSPVYRQLLAVPI